MMESCLRGGERLSNNFDVGKLEVEVELLDRRKNSFRAELTGVHLKA